MTEIIKPEPGDSNFNLFEDFPKDIYSADSLYFKVPGTINHDYLEGCYVLIKDAKVQGRAALYVNPQLFFQGKTTACIGNYESVNDKGMAAELLSHIASEAKKKGAQFLIGPMNGSTWEAYRFSVHHDHPHFFPESYHHLYYNEQFSNYGFDIIGRYSSAIETDFTFDNAAIVEREQEFKKAGVTFRNINLPEYEKELEKLFSFNAVAFRRNFLYTPVEKNTFLKKYAETKAFIDPKFVILAEDVNGDLIGYIFCLKDFYNKDKKSLVVKTVARDPDKRWSGMGHVLGSMVFMRALQGNYQSIIHSFMYEEGTSTGMSKKFSGSIFKNYVLYGKEL